MRISDWSSDVCSSDLPIPAAGRPCGSRAAAPTESKSGMRRLTLIAVATVTLAVLLLPQATLAQSVTLDLGQGGTLTGRVIQLIALMTVLTLAPSILVVRSEEHTSDLQSLMRISYAVFC